MVQKTETKTQILDEKKKKPCYTRNHHNDKETLISSLEADRVVTDSNNENQSEDENPSEKSLEWDIHETTTELEDPFNDCLLFNSPRIPVYKHNCNDDDLNKVFDFSQVLPVQSSPVKSQPQPKQAKHVKKDKFRTIGTLFKKK